nr:hypothetical protein [Angustibacter aerolatus]
MVSEPALVQRGLTNYWGYNTLGFFATEPGYAAAPDPVGAVREVKGMVKPAAPRRPRGGARRRLQPHRRAGPRRRHPVVARARQRLLLPARLLRPRRRRHRLRQHPRLPAPASRAGGARLAALLGRGVPRRRLPVRPGHGAGARARRRLRPRPPVPRGAALRPGAVAGQGDRRAVGRRAARLANRAVPAAVRRVERPLPRHRPQLLAGRRRARACGARPATGCASLATRLSGSQDLFGHLDRSPLASVNYLASHDGYTLADTVQYEQKHNLGNGENNRDGHGDNRSWHHGVEGPTDDPDVLAARRRSLRNLLGTLLVSTGVPMLAAGDEPRSHPARQQQRLLPRRRGVVAALGPRPLAGRPAGHDAVPHQAAARAAGAAPAGVLRQPAAAGRRHGRPRVVRHRRRADDARRVARPVDPHPAGAVRRRAGRRRPRAGRAGRPR